jgi:adenylate kinase
MEKIFIFLGPPGCGKGTQTTRLSQKLNIPHVDTGSLLRKNVSEQTPFGIEAKSYMDKGELVPASIVQQIIKARLEEPDAKKGYILDGFPRSLEQAKMLENIHAELNETKQIVAMYFDIPTDTLVQRLVNRRFCAGCGMIYNIKSAPPKIEDQCDSCEQKLSQRADDNEETASKRFETYNNETAPLLNYFREKGVLREISADMPIDDVWKQVEEIALN